MYSFVFFPGSQLFMGAKYEKAESQGKRHTFWVVSLIGQGAFNEFVLMKTPYRHILGEHLVHGSIVH